MLHVAESIIIEQPQDLVFDTAADSETQLHWDPSTLQQVEKLTPGPIGQGARYRGKFKGLGTLEYEFAEYDRPRRFVHQTVMPLGEMRHVFTFEQVPGGTRLTQEARLEPNLIGRIVSPVMSMMMRKRFRTIGSELRQYLAAASASPETS